MTLQTEAPVINGVQQRRFLKTAVPGPKSQELLHDALNVLEQGVSVTVEHARTEAW